MAAYRATLFYFCRQCVEEMPKPGSPRHYARLQVGLTREGELEVWCLRHDRLVGMFNITSQVSDGPTDAPASRH